jgi:hypothetical protein
VSQKCSQDTHSPLKFVRDETAEREKAKVTYKYLLSRSTVDEQREIPEMPIAVFFCVCLVLYQACIGLVWCLGQNKRIASLLFFHGYR